MAKFCVFLLEFGIKTIFLMALSTFESFTFTNQFITETFLVGTAFTLANQDWNGI